VLNPVLVERIKTLLATSDLSQRDIARLCRVSRGVVSRISLGRRHDRYAGDKQKQEDLGPAPFNGPVVRCASCGGLVAMPCLACSLRAQAEQPRAA
jgi:hypothetical protein